MKPKTLCSRLRNQLVRPFSYFAEYYLRRGYSPSSGEWFNKAIARKEFNNRAYLAFARGTNYLKLKKLTKVVDLIEGWSQANGLERSQIKVLDVGCGWNPVYSLSLASCGYKVVAIDVDEGAIGEAREAARGFTNLEFRLAEGIDYVEKGEEIFDVILVMDVLEHMAQPLRFCQAVFRHLSTSGMFIAVVPDGFSEVELFYMPVSKFLMKKFLKVRFYPGFTHVQHFSLRRIRKMLTSSGFGYKYISAIFTTRFPFVLAFLAGFRGWAAYLNTKLADRLPAFMTNSWLVCGVKKASATSREGKSEV